MRSRTPLVPLFISSTIAPMTRTEPSCIAVLMPISTTISANIER